MNRAGPVVLVILDGWGIESPSPGNAVANANTPNFDRLWTMYPQTTLKTSGRDVGLIEGQMGNSEVGHLNIGAGFIVNQSITTIDLAIEDGLFFENPAFKAAAENARRPDRMMHLLGLVSDGGVHSHIRHLQALLEFCQRERLARVQVHAILDGRDTSPTGGVAYLEQIERTCNESGSGRISTIIGRYYAMDRDRRWDRTRIAFNLLVHGAGEECDSPITGVQRHYHDGVTDEFMPPIVVTDTHGRSSSIRSEDSAVFFNFRSDRPRQLTQSLVGPEIDGQDFSDRPRDLTFVTMTTYADYLPVLSAFEPVMIEQPLARVIADAGLRQFHTAETEKYAHVTYFLNGGREEPFEGEQRLLVPSPKVATYDLQPEMSAHGVALATCDAVESGEFDFIVVNFANCDMVGHTGDVDAAIQAVEATDSELSLVIGATLQAQGMALVIADHGNAERMYVPGTQDPMTAHTTNPVPCVLVTPDSSALRHVGLRSGGRLADVAPTILDILGLEKPESMTGTTLIE